MSKKKPQSGSRAWVVIILTIGVCLSPLVLTTGSLQRALLISLFSMGMVASIGFWLFFFPFDFKDNSHFISLPAVFCRLLRQNYDGKLQIKNGVFWRDYFSIQEKPHIPALMVDRNSVAVITNTRSSRIVLHPGNHLVERGAQIVHVFNTSPQYFQYGPGTSAHPVVELERANSNLRRVHTLKRESANTRCQTRDGVVLIPVFMIHYRMHSVHSNRQTSARLKAFSALLEKEQTTGNMGKRIEALIGKMITGQFRRMIETMEMANWSQGTLINRDMHAFLQSQISSPTPNKAIEKAICDLYTIRTRIQEIWVD